MIDWSQVKTAADKEAESVLAERGAFKASRSEAVKAIQVTTSAGNTFDGDETSQARMARAIIALPVGGTVNWVLANNAIIAANTDELREALALAGAEQARLWVKTE